jgi:hypothetical protein
MVTKNRKKKQVINANIYQAHLDCACERKLSKIERKQKTAGAPNV